MTFLLALLLHIQARAGRIGRDKIVDLLSDPNLNSVQQLGDFFLLYLIAKNMDEVRVDKNILMNISKIFPVLTRWVCGS